MEILIKSIEEVFREKHPGPVYVGLDKSRTKGARDKEKRNRFYSRYAKLKGKMSEGKAFVIAKKE